MREDGVRLVVVGTTVSARVGVGDTVEGDVDVGVLLGIVVWVAGGLTVAVRTGLAVGRYVAVAADCVCSGVGVSGTSVDRGVSCMVGVDGMVGGMVTIARIGAGTNAGVGVAVGVGEGVICSLLVAMTGCGGIAACQEAITSPCS
jgi:hypothetical protein